MQFYVNGNVANKSYTSFSGSELCFTLRVLELNCFFFWQRSTSAYHSLVSTAVLVRTRLGPTSVSAGTALVEKAVRLVRLSIDPWHSQKHKRIFTRIWLLHVNVPFPLRHKWMPVWALHEQGDMWGSAWFLLVSLSTRLQRPELWNRCSGFTTTNIVHLANNIRGRILPMCKYLCAEQDGCESSPCLNGGVCRGYRQYYVCTCKDGFFGERCQMCK